VIYITSLLININSGVKDALILAWLFTQPINIVTPLNIDENSCASSLCHVAYTTLMALKAINHPNVTTTVTINQSPFSPFNHSNKLNTRLKSLWDPCQSYVHNISGIACHKKQAYSRTFCHQTDPTGAYTKIFS